MSIRNRIPAIGNGFWFRCRPSKTRPFCTRSGGATKNFPTADKGGGGGGMTREEAYKQLQNLDFMTAAKILFTAPPKKKKFGLDFHLVQLFFVCMPSLAVYLVAQYARADMKKMDAELKLKRKKAEEEENAKEAEKASKGKVSDTELFKVKDRLDALEEVVKEIADKTKKNSKSIMTKEAEVGRKEPTNMAGVPVKQPVTAIKDSRGPIIAAAKSSDSRK